MGKNKQKNQSNENGPENPKSSWDHAHMDLRRIKRKIQKNTDGPQKFKKRDLKDARRKVKDKQTHDTKNQMKQIWEALRTMGGDPTKKQAMAKEVFKTIEEGSKEELGESLEKFCRNHETSRIIQCMLSKGETALKVQICEALLPKFCDIMTVKYANFVALKMVDCIGVKSTRQEFLNRLITTIIEKKGPKMNNLVRDGFSSPIIELIFAHHCKLIQKQNMIACFFGKDYVIRCERHLGADYENYSISNLFAKITAEDERLEILNNATTVFEKFLNREALQTNSLVHAALLQLVEALITFSSESEKIKTLCSEFTVTMREVIPFFCHTAYGSKVAHNLIWLGSAKDRKAILKSMTKDDKVTAMAKLKYSSVVLVCLLDSVDDTKLLSSAIIGPLMKMIEDVMLEKSSDDGHAHKIFQYITSGRTALHKDSIRALVSAGDEFTKSKKDSQIRQKEVFTYYADSLVKTLTEDNIESWVSHGKTVPILADTVKFALEFNLTKKYAPLLEIIMNAFADKIEEPQASFGLRWIFKAGKENPSEFLNHWIDTVVCDYCAAWLTSNRGCFGLVQACEANPSETLKTTVKKTVKKSKNIDKSCKGFAQLKTDYGL